MGGFVHDIHSVPRHAVSRFSIDDRSQSLYHPSGVSRHRHDHFPGIAAIPEGLLPEMGFLSSKLLGEVTKK